MPLRSPGLKSAPHLVSDWVELTALSTPRGVFRLSSLRRLWDVSRESENSDPEGETEREADTDQDGVSGDDVDIFIDSISEEIADRAKALGDAYPFKLDSSNCLTVHASPTVGGILYVFCLLLTHSNGHELLDGSWRPAVNHRVRDLFQACSTVAAAGEIQGCAISFGWPRPDNNTAFLPRLQEVYREFGEGVVVTVRRPGTSPFSKDEEIDVIAWRPQADHAPGTLYLLGQVASGDNWMSKSIVGQPINSFHRDWFEPPPPSPPLASIFIPHAVPPIDSQGTRRERLDVLTAKFGIIFDRLRLPRKAADGIALASTNNALLIERVRDIDSIRPWVIAQINELHRITS